MKAMVLAAGFGTRLLPLTETLPKPLVPADGVPLVDGVLHHLRQCGFAKAVVNAHHFSGLIREHVRSTNYGMDVRVLEEPERLGTGGGIANARPHLSGGPFLVINADVVCDLDLSLAMDFHQSHPHPVTMVLTDHPRFNTVRVENGLVKELRAPDGHQGPLYTFTGIHVLDPVVFDYLPPGHSNIIHVYRHMMDNGLFPAAWFPEGFFWQDAGTHQGLEVASLARGAVRLLCPEARLRETDIKPLAGDGSDRRWFRVAVRGKTAVAAAHGVAGSGGMPEARAMAAIGRHLEARGAPVPRILGQDQFCGLVYVEDLGDVHLAGLAGKGLNAEVLALYEQAVRALAAMNVDAAKGFDPAWTWQTPCYDQALAVEKESRYFVEAFVRDYLGKNVDFEEFREECEALAAEALADAVTGFLHRDCQSRNILVKDAKPRFIDFAGGRLGPLGYDLASLLIDPYARLPQNAQDRLYSLYVNEAKKRITLDTEAFGRTYNLLALHRNMQVLGAFAFLGGQKGKPGFLKHIPHALASLKERMQTVFGAPRLAKLVQSL
ncbi:MAG: phosphotransferase [Deltaproteobacteria bacterium]|nr:phosphotransferase [Deltaproteobacteria bacterium]